MLRALAEPGFAQNAKRKMLLEPADEEADRQVGGDGGDHDAENDLAVDVRAGAAGQGRQLEDAGGEDRRVARRNVNRAASSWSRPRHRPPTMVTPDRLIPANRAVICSTPT